MKAIDWIERVRARHECSYYRAAELMGVGRAAVSNAKNGRSLTLDAVTAKRVEELLDLPEGTVLVDQEAERAPTPEIRAVWQRLGKLMTDAGRGAAVGVVVTFCLMGILLLSAPNQALAGANSTDILTIMRRLARSIRERSAATLRASFARSCNRWNQTKIIPSF